MRNLEPAVKLFEAWASTSRRGRHESGASTPSGTLEAVNRIAKVAHKRRLDEPDASWTEHWQTRPVAERLAMATELSRECVDGDPRQGLRRVHRVLRRS